MAARSTPTRRDAVAERADVATRLSRSRSSRSSSSSTWCGAFEAGALRARTPGRRRRSSGRRRRVRRARTATSIACHESCATPTSTTRRAQRQASCLRRELMPTSPCAACSCHADSVHRLQVRPDTGLTNPKLGVWLFLASEVMLFGSLFSSYALLRAGRRVGPISHQSSTFRSPR